MPSETAPTLTRRRAVAAPCVSRCPVSRARLLVAGALLVGATGWLAALGGDEQPAPAVAVNADPPHFSPAHSPGEHDTTRLVTAVDVQQAGAVVTAYRLVISDEDGRPVRTMDGDSGEPIPDVVPRLLIDLGLQESASDRGAGVLHLGRPRRPGRAGSGRRLPLRP